MIIFINLNKFYLEYGLYYEINKSFIDMNKFELEENNIKTQIFNFINNYIDFFSNIKIIYISVSCILNEYEKKYKLIPSTNFDTEHEIYLPKKYKNINIKIYNENEVFIESFKIIYNNINYNKINCIGINFRKHLNCSILIKDKLIENTKINLFLQEYTNNIFLNDENLDSFCKNIGNELSKIIEIMNIDYIFLSGYVNKFNNFDEKIKKYIIIDKYYLNKLTINYIYDDSNKNLFKGLMKLSKLLI